MPITKPQTFRGIAVPGAYLVIRYIAFDLRNNRAVIECDVFASAAEAGKPKPEILDTKSYVVENHPAIVSPPVAADPQWTQFMADINGTFKPLPAAYRALKRIAEWTGATDV